MIDEVGQGFEGFQGVALGWGFGLFGVESFEGLLGEDDSAVAISFEVDADVKFGCCVVEPFHTSGSADYWEFEGLGHIVGACAIGICGLHDSDLKLLDEASFFGELSNERGGQSRNFITI